MRGFTAGAFDLLHAGHVIFLQKCKQRCDELVVGLHVDPSKERKGKTIPVQSILERTLQLQACRYVDKIIVYETEDDLEIILCNLDIDIRFLGSDYEQNQDEITGKGLVPIEYIPRNHLWSSTKLKERIRAQ